MENYLATTTVHGFSYVHGRYSLCTRIFWLCNIIAGFAGADYVFSHGETFIVWILMAILVNNCLKK